MNTPSPLVPQGTSPDRGKSSLYFKIIGIVAFHVVVIGGFLLQGCKDTKSASPDTTQTSTSDQTNTDLSALPPVNTNYTPAVAPTPTPGTNAYATTPPPITPGTNPMANNSMTPGPVTPIPAPVTAPAAPETKDYIIARGDTLAAIAKKNGVSLKALVDANPGVNPRKLKIGAKLEIPGSDSGSSVAAAGGSGVGNGVDMGDSMVYTVKAGDMLGRIARAHGTTVAKIKELNDLKSTSIKVGQKLKLPGAKTGNEPSTALTAPVAPTAMYAAAQTGGSSH